MNERLSALREALIAYLPKGPNIRVIDRPGWLQLINSAGRSVYQNTVYIAEFPASTSEKELENSVDAAIAEYTELGLSFRWIIGPWTRPANLEALLLRKGFSLGRQVYGMTREAPMDASAADPRLAVEVVDASNIERWARTYCKAWEMPEGSLPAQLAYAESCLADPRFTNYLAYVDGIPAAVASSSFLAHSAYFSNSAVVPEFRGKGVFRKLVESHCRAAVEAGRPIASLFAFEDTSFPILKKMGFEVDCESPQFFYMQRGATGR